MPTQLGHQAGFCSEEEEDTLPNLHPGQKYADGRHRQSKLSTPWG